MTWVFHLDFEPSDGMGLIYNSLERCLMCGFVIIASSLTAVVFGMAASGSSVFPEKYELMYNKISKIHTIMNTTQNMPNTAGNGSINRI